MNDAPLFVQTYDLYAWLLDRMEGGNTYPSLRHTLLRQSSLLVEEVALGLAHFDTRERARSADELTATLRVQLRIAADKGLLNDDQLLFAADGLRNIGKQLGGWRKRLDAVDGPRASP